MDNGTQQAECSAVREGKGQIVQWLQQQSEDKAKPDQASLYLK